MKINKMYAGFIVLDVQNNAMHQFLYQPNVDNVTAENRAIAGLMHRLDLPRGNFQVTALIKKV
jgi:hypothetical protein